MWYEDSMCISISRTLNDLPVDFVQSPRSASRIAEQVMLLPRDLLFMLHSTGCFLSSWRWTPRREIAVALQYLQCISVFIVHSHVIMVEPISTPIRYERICSILTRRRSHFHVKCFLRDLPSGIESSFYATCCPKRLLRD